MPPCTNLLVTSIVALVLFLTYLLNPAKTEDAYVKAHADETKDPTTPLGQLCSAYRLLSDLYAAAQKLALTLFEVLDLDHCEHPFFLLSDCMYPRSRNHGEALDRIMEAWLPISANDNGFTTSMFGRSTDLYRRIRRSSRLDGFWNALNKAYGYPILKEAGAPSSEQRGV
ncbi:hypothetical protein QQZ08_004610 [Neonectria magnoliae]|uniref:Uncharacterized protein n=1 Tax=Neonectria magnoliae TaxID=2732573 RepID=A0ABR1I768_9HYPO